MTIKDQIKQIQAKVKHKNLFLKLKYLRARAKYEYHKANAKYFYYKGKVSMLHPLQDLEPGNLIITPYGIGYVKYKFPRRGPSVSKNSMVEVWFKKRYYKAFKIDNVFQYYVYHDILDIHIPLAPDCYQYIIGNDDEVEFRVTSGGFADLSPYEKEKREYVRVFSNKRGGRTLMRELIEKGYKF